uniref:Acyltransferase n=1 Tax=Sphenodon punctatus TaxID=8508 RepID=A0A8D0G9Y9_SPHPU
MKIEFAPLCVPLERRLQTLSVLQWVFSFLFLELCCCGIFVFLLFGDYWFVSVLYALWLYFDWETPELVKTEDLDPRQNYLFGVHPHGIFVTGAFGNFCTEYSSFKELFPGFTPYIHFLSSMLKWPFYRDYLMCAGIVSSSKKSVSHVLNNDSGGNVSVILIGGAEESLYAQPGEFTLTIHKRRGFINLALKYGAQLVPVFSFGENDLYTQIAASNGSWFRILQARLQKMLGFALPVFHGRGIFQYNFGLLPYRKPIYTVVGKPIVVKQNQNPTPEEIDQLHQTYLQELQKLFEENKGKNGIPEHKTLVFI